MTKISKDVTIGAFFSGLILYINRITPLGNFVIKKCSDPKKNWKLPFRKKFVKVGFGILKKKWNQVIGASPFPTNLPTCLRFWRCKNGGKEDWNFCLEKDFIKKKGEKKFLKNLYEKEREK